MTAYYDYVTHWEDGEDTYRRSGSGDEFGYYVPEALIARREAAEAELDAADEAIRRHIADHDLPEVELNA